MLSARLRSLGPALIVGSVVLGPGSILTASRVGADFGYALTWVVVLAAGLMAVTTALAARLGCALERTPCEEVAARAGRPLAALVGVVLFLVVACFQFSNNVAVVAALSPLFDAGKTASVVAVLAVNAACAAAFLGMRRLYRPVEAAMKILVGLMALAFVASLVLARPSASAVAGGLLPGLPASLSGSLLPRLEGEQLIDPWLPLVGLVGTTFSVAGAFYQAYLVREKGWTRGDIGRGLVDSVVGICVLGALTTVVMLTAATVLHGEVAGAKLGSAADVARALEPLFGRLAVALFCAGLLAGAASSFLVNVMIGGTFLSDGLGLGGRMDQRGPRICTLLALGAGMGVALLVLGGGWSPVDLVLFAQAATVLGNPILAGVLLWLASQRGPDGARFAPAWMRATMAVALVLVLALALRTGVRVWLLA